MPPMLVALTEGPNIPLDKPVLLVGRHQECDVQIPSRKISRRHCCIAQVHDYLVVRDLFSTNGVRINGARVKEGALHAGDELTIGNYRYKIQAGAPSSAPEPQVNIAPIPAPLPMPNLVAADRLESCEMPVALAEGKRPETAPLGLPLVLPVNASMKPNAPGEFAGLSSGEFRAGAPPR